MTVKDALCPSTWGHEYRQCVPKVPKAFNVLRDRLRSISRGMCAWFVLGGAVVSEVSATLALRQALDRPAFFAVVGIGYALAFILLSLALRLGMSLGVAYGIWGALGVALTALLSAILFGESITAPVAVGIMLIMAGVLLVEIGAQRAGSQQDDEGDAP